MTLTKISWTSDEKKHFKAIRKLASEALSECRVEINNINMVNGQSSTMMAWWDSPPICNTSRRADGTLCYLSNNPSGCNPPNNAPIC